MKKFVFILFSCFIGFHNVMAQDVTYIHDEAKLVGIELKLIGAGDVSSQAIYNANGNYVSEYGTPKRSFGKESGLTMLWLKDEPEQADSIKADLKHRSEKSAENMVEYATSVFATGFGLDKSLENEIDGIQQRINMLSLYGCPKNTEKQLTTEFNLLKYRQTLAGKGYQPTSQRKQIYTKLYDDAVSFNKSLRKVLVMLYTDRYYSGSATHDPDAVYNMRMKRENEHKRIYAQAKKKLLYYVLATMPSSGRSSTPMLDDSSGAKSNQAKATKVYFYGN